MTNQFRLRSSLSAVVFAVVLPVLAHSATVYTAVLTGASEVPPTGSTAFGSIVVTLNGNMLTVAESFSGLTGGVATGAHIHCCGPLGVNEPIAVPFGAFPATTSGTYTNTFDLTLTSTYTAAYLTAQGGTAASGESALIAALNAGQTYANIHDAVNPGGEIRGQLALAPEPSTTGMWLFGLLPAAVLAFRKRRVSKLALAK